MGNGEKPNGRVLWFLLGTLGMAVVGGVSHWLLFGQRLVSRSDMVEYVNEQSPYTRASGRIALQISTNATHIEKTANTVKELTEQISKYMREQERFNAITEAAVRGIQESIRKR